MSLKERLQGKKVLEETVTVDGEKLLVRAVSRAVTSAMFAECRSKKGVLNTTKAENKLLSVCVLDPESKQPVMDENEWGPIAPHISRPLISVVMRVCGLDETDLGDPKDSDSTQS